MIKYLHLKIIILMVTIVISNQSVIGQCLDPIKNYVDETSKMTAPKKKQMYFMQFKMTTVPTKNSSSKPSTVESKIIRSKDQLIYETKDVSIYRDTLLSFMIIHPLKRIVWGQSTKEEQGLTNMDVASAQNILLDESELVSCEEITTKNGHEILQVMLKPNEKIQKELMVDFSKMEFDVTANRLLKVESIFSKGHKFSRQIIEYQVLDYNYKGSKIKPAKSMVFGKAGKLLPAFSNYTLIEN